MSCAAEALNKPCLSECGSERFAGVPASSVTVKDRSADLLPVLQFKLCHGSDAKLLLHIAIHCYGKDLAVVAIENCRYVQFSVIALYFGNVGKQFPKRLFGLEIPFYEVLAVLNLYCGLCCAAPSPSSVQNPHFRHRSVYSTKAYADPFLFKSHVYPPDMVFVLVVQNKYVSLAGLYLFRVFMFNKLNRKNRVRHLICYLPPEALRFPVQARGC